MVVKPGLECPVFYPTMEDVNGPFERYIEKIERRASKAGVAKIIAPKGWNPRKAGYGEDLDFQIDRCIKQVATGSKGLYRFLLVEQKPMSLKDDFKPIALAPENQPGTDVASELERKYWKNIALRPPLYGADVEGSLFDEAAKGWSLSRLDTMLTSVMAADGHALPGVNTPYLYFGMWKSTFAWHAEDMDLYSVNYLHFGAPKSWFIIPPKHQERFKMVVQNMIPDVFRGCPEFLRHKELLVSTALLEQHQIPVIRVTQNPREFIVNFPGIFHCGFNQGYNCAESVNFATKRWIQYGAHANVCQCNPDSVSINMKLFRHLVPKRQLPAELFEDTSSEEEDEDEEMDVKGEIPSSPKGAKGKGAAQNAKTAGANSKKESKGQSSTAAAVAQKAKIAGANIKKESKGQSSTTAAAAAAAAQNAKTAGANSKKESKGQSSTAAAAAAQKGKITGANTKKESKGQSSTAAAAAAAAKKVVAKVESKPQGSSRGQPVAEGPAVVKEEADAKAAGATKRKRAAVQAAVQAKAPCKRQCKSSTTDKTAAKACTARSCAASRSQSALAQSSLPNQAVACAPAVPGQQGIAGVKEDQQMDGSAAAGGLCPCALSPVMVPSPTTGPSLEVRSTEVEADEGMLYPAPSKGLSFILSSDDEETSQGVCQGGETSTYVTADDGEGEEPLTSVPSTPVIVSPPSQQASVGDDHSSLGQGPAPALQTECVSADHVKPEPFHESLPLGAKAALHNSLSLRAGAALHSSLPLGAGAGEFDLGSIEPASQSVGRPDATGQAVTLRAASSCDVPRPEQNSVGMPDTPGQAVTLRAASPCEVPRAEQNSVGMPDATDQAMTLRAASSCAVPTSEQNSHLSGATVALPEASCGQAITQEQHLRPLPVLDLSKPGDNIASPATSQPNMGMHVDEQQTCLGFHQAECGFNVEAMALANESDASASATEASTMVTVHTTYQGHEPQPSDDTLMQPVPGAADDAFMHPPVAPGTQPGMASGDGPGPQPQAQAPEAQSRGTPGTQPGMATGDGPGPQPQAQAPEAQSRGTPDTQPGMATGDGPGPQPQAQAPEAQSRGTPGTQPGMATGDGPGPQPQAQAPEAQSRGTPDTQPGMATGDGPGLQPQPQAPETQSPDARGTQPGTATDGLGPQAQAPETQSPDAPGTQPGTATDGLGPQAQAPETQSPDAAGTQPGTATDGLGTQAQAPETQSPGAAGTQPVFGPEIPLAAKSFVNVHLRQGSGRRVVKPSWKAAAETDTLIA
eukprot:gene2219-33779_t